MHSKKICAIVVILLIALGTFSCTNVENKGDLLFSGGKGTADSPYLLSSASDLRYLAENIGDNKLALAYYCLTNDVDLGNDNWTPIGFFRPGQSSPFRGNFDGCGYTIKNMKVNISEGDIGHSYSQGFFAYIAGTEERPASISNLNLEHAEIDFQGPQGVVTYIGILSGKTGDMSSQSVTIRNCSVQGNIVNRNTNVQTGLFTGENWGSIEQCRTTGSIRHSAGRGETIYIGGFGGTNSGLIKNCSSDSEIIIETNMQYANIGGFVGRNDILSVDKSVEISDSHAKGSLLMNVKGEFAYVGGFVGFNGKTIKDCDADMKDQSGTAIEFSGSDNI